MKILLLNIPNDLNRPKDYDVLRAPYGLAMISAVLKQHDFDVQLIDAQALEMGGAKILSFIEETKPDIVGMSSFTLQINDIITFSKRIKEHHPQTKVVLGGPHVTAEPEETLTKSSSIDYIVIGEGEFVMLELVKSLQAGKSPHTIAGLAFRNHQQIQINPPTHFIEDLDQLPYADWESLPIDRYYDIFTIRKPYGMLLATRGCCFNCIFCAAKVTQGRKIRRRSPKHFVGELKLLYSKYGIREFNICDSTFNFDNSYVRDICAEIQHEQLKISWHCTVRADCVDRQTIRAMRSSGCSGVFMGIESADPAVLKMMKKGVTLEQIKESLEILKEEKMPVHPSFILGMPGDSPASIEATISLAKRVNQSPENNVGITLATPFPGTELFEQAKRENSSLHQRAKLDSFQAAYIPPGMTKKELERYYRTAMKELYFTPKYLFHKIVNIRSFHQLAIGIRYANRMLMRSLRVGK